MRIRKTVLAFAVPSVIVVAVSVLLTLRSGDAASRPDGARFSGSSVVQRMKSLLPPARLPSPVSVAVIRDEAAAEYYEPGRLDSLIAAWQRVLGDVGATVRVVSSRSPAAARDARVILIPSSPCLTVATRELVERAAAAGQGIVVSGLTGVNDAGCRPIGYGFIVALTGASRAAALEKRDMVYVTIPSAGPLGFGIPPGARIDLDPGLQVALRRSGREAFYSDYGLLPFPADSQPLLDAAVARGRYGRSRVVYWGFEPRHAVRVPWNQSIVRLLARNTLAYVASLNQVGIEPWPRGFEAAAAVAQDVEDRFANSRHALDSLRAAEVPATFFLTSNLASEHEQLAHDLDAAGEIGTHSENHRMLGGLPFEHQLARLRDTQRELESLLGLPVLGLRPPAEQFDSATMAAWVSAGGNYLFGANDSRSVAPELLPVGRDTLVLLGRGGGDDFALAQHARNADSMAAALLREYRHARQLGGLFVLSYHSQLLGRAELVPALAKAARAIKADTSVWLATTGDIARWWRARAEVSLQLRQRGTGTLELVVRNRGTAIVDGAVAAIRLGTPKAVSGASVPVLPGASDLIRLQLPPLLPGTTRVLSVNLAGEGSSAARRSMRSSARAAPWFQFWR